jgi:hypothetical protein
MKPTARTVAGAALGAALDRMSYDYLATNAPDLLLAIEEELDAGISPEGVRFFVQRRVGPDREGLALRCEQAARHMAVVTRQVAE